VRTSDEEPRGPATPAEHDVATPDSDNVDAATEDEPLGPAAFPHPPWTVGLVLVAGGITLLFGILVSPIWLLVGSPFVLALFLWLYVRLFVRP